MASSSTSSTSSSMSWFLNTYYNSATRYKTNTVCGIVSIMVLFYFYAEHHNYAIVAAINTAAGPLAHKVLPSFSPFAKNVTFTAAVDLTSPPTTLQYCGYPTVWSSIVGFNSDQLWVFWGLILGFTITDKIVESNGLVGTWRIQYNNPHNEENNTTPPTITKIDWRMWATSLHWSVCNSILSTAFWPVYLWIGFATGLLVEGEGICTGADLPSPPLPSWLMLGRNAIGTLVLADVWFYSLHRLMHTRLLYPYVHKQHHQVRASFAAGSIGCHPFEHVLINLPSIVLPGFVFHPNRTTYLIWSIIAVTNSVASHCGYTLPWWVPTGGDPHDMHHWVIHCEYGAGGFLDFLLKTRYSDWLKRKNVKSE